MADDPTSATLTVAPRSPILPSERPDGHLLWRALLVLAALRGVVPVFLNTIANGGHIYDVAAVTQAGSTASATQIGLVLDMAMSAIAIARLVSITRGPERVRPPLARLLLIAMVLVAVAVNYRVTGQVYRSVIVVTLTIVGLTLAPPPARQAVRTFWTIGLFSIAATWVAAWAVPDLAWVNTGTEDRLSLISGERLAGVFSHPNELAYWTSALLAVGVAYRLPFRGLALAALTVTAVAAGSRTALIAAAVVLIISVVRGALGTLVRRLMALLLLVAVAIPATVSADFVDSIGRQEIWTTARDVWPNSPYFGHGLFYWQTGQARSDGFPSFAFHAHNTVLDSLVLGGAVLAVAVLAYLAVHAWELLSWTRTRGTPLPGLSALILITAITEVPIQFAVVDPRTVVLVIATLVVAHRKADS